MRSGLIISGLLHAALLFVLLTEPLEFAYQRPERPQPLVEFTSFDTTEAIEAELEELAEKEPESEVGEEPPPDSLSEVQGETPLAEEAAAEETAEEVAQDDPRPEPEAETLAEDASEPEVAEEIADEALQESPQPELADVSPALELPALPDAPLPPADAEAPEVVPSEPETAQALAAEEVLPAPALSESLFGQPDLAEAEAPVPQGLAGEPVEDFAEALPDALDSAQSEPLPEALLEGPPEPLTAEEIVEALELALPLAPLPPRRPQSFAELPPLDLPEAAPERPAEQGSETAANETQPGAPLPSELTTQYRPQWSGRVSGQQLLDNLALVRDEAAQAAANPALWEVVRLLRQQVKECWRLGRPGLDNPGFVVEMEVRLQRSGAVEQAHILDVAQMVDDETFAAFARNARGALVGCGPYDLPADRYALWGDLVVRFLARGQGIAGR